MWLDNASKIDLLFYKPYSDVIVEILDTNNMTPLTIGLYGSWGAGKSSLLKFISKETTKKSNMTSININAWELEGYDDAKLAIIEALLVAIQDNKKISKKVKENVKKLTSHVNILIG